MKKIIYIFIAISVLALSSCQNWLDVQPKTEIKKDKIFETKSGFEETLIGAYILMGDEALYGRELTAGFMDVIAHQYSLKETSSYLPAYNHEYFSLIGGDLNVAPDGVISQIWSKMYHVIANLNAIIAEADMKKGTVLDNAEYSLIKGEALALRAYLHLDLLRMFGWGNIENDKSVLQKLSIPYAVNYDKELTKQSTVEDVLKYLNKDLDEAIKLLEFYDPISDAVRPADYSIDEEAIFNKNRQSRMNYYAALATKGRVAMWAADYDNAIEYFQEATANLKTIKWVDATEFSRVSNSWERDLRMSSEHLFRLDVYALYEGLSVTSTDDGLKPLFDDYSYRVDNSVLINDEYFYIELAEFNTVYYKDSDIRADFLYSSNNDNTGYLLDKYKEDEFSSFDGLNKMALLKLSEIYLSLAECNNKKGNSATAIGYLNDILTNRGVRSQDLYSSSLTTSEITEAITREMRCELIGEGQMFYYYKRLNMDIPKQSSTKELIFTLPLPATEVDLGFREDNVSER